MEVTLLDLGLATPIGGRPYRCNEGGDYLLLEEERENYYYHLSPEVFHGGPATPASDVYSLGALLSRVLTQLDIQDENLSLLADRATAYNPQHRPHLRQIREEFAKLLKN